MAGKSLAKLCRSEYASAYLTASPTGRQTEPEEDRHEKGHWVMFARQNLRMAAVMLSATLINGANAAPISQDKMVPYCAGEVAGMYGTKPLSQPPKAVPSFGWQLGRLAWPGSGIRTKIS